MVGFDDHEYAKNQYADSSNLVTRVQLHDRFSVNHYGWTRWVFDQFRLQPGSRILELGCGTGGLWRYNLNRVPFNCSVLLTDFSDGMLKHTSENLAGQEIFKFQRVDANERPLPFGDSSFDTVIANHMIYHVSDRDGLYSEIRRILKPNGLMYASTVGQRHMIEIVEMISEFDQKLGETWGKPMNIPDSFALENGASALSPWFSDIRLLRYDDALEVTEVEPLVDYVASGWFDIDTNRLQVFKELAKRTLESRGGVFHVTKDSGMFEAVRM